MKEVWLQKLFRIVNENPLENPLFSFRRWTALPWLQPKPEDATILFIDICASVRSKMDYPEIWHENVYTLHSRASRIIRACHGRVSKFIGDCVMAFFTGKGHEANGLWCAAALLETFALLKDFFDPDMDSTLWRFPVTLGLASGPVYFLYRGDPFGLPVDLASRLQGLAIPLTAVIFAGTMDGAGNATEAAPLSKFLGQRQTVLVKSFGDVSVIKMSRPETS
ncbi:MAG: adenylate/guanylate cyclase domain-containing protein [Nitrospirae bacterium]|nr:adenylate/guanylate cyclase domain-containing protein [Nitrospirota bacterium]